jgi:hypothetical protein
MIGKKQNKDKKMNTATQTPAQTQTTQTTQPPTQTDDSVKIQIIAANNQWQFSESGKSNGIEALLLLSQDLEVESDNAYQTLLSFLSANPPANIANKELNYSFIEYNEFLVEIINYISMNVVDIHYLILCEGEDVYNKYAKY